MRVLLTGGGTGGHIYPGLSLWNYFLEQQPNAEVLYVGTDKGLEKDIVARTGLPFRTVPAAPLRRELSLKAVSTALETWKGYRAARKLIRTFRPDVVLGTGGYVTLPVIYAAAKERIPTVVWEANARPGLTNQLCARKAHAVAVCFSGGERFFPRGTKLVMTGNPRGSEVLRVPLEAVEEGKRAHHLRPEQKLIVGYMGSRGAETVNRIMADLMPRFAEKPDWKLIWVTGDVHYDTFVKSVQKPPHNVEIVPFLHDMPSVLASASAVLTRAGGATLSEVCSLGLGAVLIPSPYVTANHQEENAKRLADEGAAVMLREKELTEDKLWGALERVLDTEDGETMRENAKKLATPAAVADLYRLLMEAYEASK